MSSMERKLVLRVEIPELRGKSMKEVYPHFLRILGEPTDIDEYDGEIEYFVYEGVQQSAYDCESKKWGVDYVLHHESDYRTYIEKDFNGLSLCQFKEIAHEMARKFNTDPSQVKLYAYEWYNGGDEPITFD